MKTSVLSVGAEWSVPVLMDRHGAKEQDFANINPVFFTTSQAGQKRLCLQEKRRVNLKCI